MINTYDQAWNDKDLARKAVRFERKLELAMEGHRFFDLVRWDTDAEFLNAYFNYEAKFIPSHFAGASFEDGVDEYLPIPSRTN